jgi:hypothetical protein
LLNVSFDGLKTKTPELKQSGHPASGAADNSSLSNKSSISRKTRQSESRKTHFVYSSNNQQFIFVNVHYHLNLILQQ